MKTDTMNSEHTPEPTPTERDVVNRFLHPATKDLVLRFAEALAVKLTAAQLKYGYSDGWRSRDWLDECRRKLVEHVSKGDPLDVAAYCAFLWHHDEFTSLAGIENPEAVREVIEELRLTRHALYNLQEEGYMHLDRSRVRDGISIRIKAIETALAKLNPQTEGRAE